MLLDPVFYVFGIVDAEGRMLTPFYRDSRTPELIEAVEENKGSTMVRCRAALETTMAAKSLSRKPGRPRKEPRSEFEALVREGMDALEIESYAELSRLINCSTGLLQQWFIGSSRPTDNYIAVLSNALGLDEAELADAADTGVSDRIKKVNAYASLHEFNEMLRANATETEKAMMYKGTPIEYDDGYEDPGLRMVRLRLKLDRPKFEK